MPWIPREVQRIRTGVSIAMRKFPVQFPAVVTETAAPRTSRGNISLVTTQTVGLKKKTFDVYKYTVVLLRRAFIPPAIGKVKDKETDKQNDDIANSSASLFIFSFQTNSEGHNEGGCQ